MRLIKYLVPLFAVLLLLMTGRAAHAGGVGIVFNLDTPIFAINGLETNLTGMIQNVGGPDIFLNDIQIAFDGGGGTFLTGDKSIFINNVPGIFVVGDPVYNGPVIGVISALLTPPGFYTGTVTLLGGFDENALTTLASANFQIQTAAAPEPSAAALLLTGAFLPFCRRFHRRQKG